MQSNDKCITKSGNAQNVLFKRNIYKDQNRIFGSGKIYYASGDSQADYPGFKIVLRAEHTSAAAAGGADLGDVIATFKMRFKWVGVFFT